MPEADVQTHLWSREKHNRLRAGGRFHPEERLELIEGEILPRSPHGRYSCKKCPQNNLWQKFSRIPAGSEPEPDIAIVTGTPQVYRDEHPTAAELVIEIADTTLA